MATGWLGVVGAPNIEKAVLVAGLFILCSAENGAVTRDLDARDVAVRETELEERHLPFREAVDKNPDLPPQDDSMGVEVNF